MVFVAFFFIMTSFCVCLCPTQTCYKCKAQASYFARFSPSLPQLSNQRERDTYAHVFNTRRKSVPEGCITLCTLNGYIHDTSVWHLLYTCCCCVKLWQFGPHCKRQVNASFLILLPQHLYVSALPQNDTLIKLSKDSINFYNLQIIRDKNEY